MADERVKDAAISALENKGLKFQENNPDLLVSYTTVTGRGMKLSFILITMAVTRASV
ncbi:hypothetical protein ACFJIV_18260 [Mucilaginibacter sp. UC70_90]